MPELKPCPFCGGTNVHMLDPEQVDAVSWICAIECRDCQVVVQPNYCEPDAQSAQYSARVDWNRRPDTDIPADQALVPRATLERFVEALNGSDSSALALSFGELRALLQR
jgi:Lar family restriction alleviation protein